MKIRCSLKKIILLITVVNFLSVQLFAQQRSHSKHPNFVFILVDDLGWTSTSSLMDNQYPDSRSHYLETPNIDRLGNEGMRFTNGYAPAAICTPSRRSIQFGQSPIHMGKTDFAQNYDPDNHHWLTIPWLLKSIDSNYRTAHFGKWDLRANIFPEDLGYDESDGDTHNSNGDLMTDKSTKWTQVYITNDPKKTVSITGRAMNFMHRMVASDHPFYLQVSYYAVHVDMETMQQTLIKYLHKQKGPVHDIPGFAGMLENTDTGIGEILDTIQSLGIANDTYIILMSDNGGVELYPPPSSFHKLEPPSDFPKKEFNYPLRGGKWVLYEGGIRVPFIIAGPGIKANSYCHVPVIGYDILPTISALAGNKNPLPDYLDGGSITPLLSDPQYGKVIRKNNDLYFHRFTKAYEHSAIIEGNYKLIEIWKTHKVELYDLNKDVGETHDISAQMPDKVAELKTKLNNYLAQQHIDTSLAKPKKNKKNKKNSKNDNDEEDD